MSKQKIIQDQSEGDQAKQTTKPMEAWRGQRSQQKEIALEITHPCFIFVC